MIYGKIVNDTVIYAPTNYKTATGEMIFNFNQRPDLMGVAGYKEVRQEGEQYQVKEEDGEMIMLENSRTIEDKGDYILITYIEEGGGE